jgi:hypothetical protein
VPQRGKIDPAQIAPRGGRYPSRQSISDAGENAMTNASNALLWTALYFALAFAAIFVVWFADKMRSNFLGKR